jgi:multidrug efflux pump subunit AcrB
VFDKLARGYAWALRGALRYPIPVLVLAAAVMVGAWSCAKQLKQEMVPSQDQSRLMVNLTTTVGASLDETDALTKRAEAILARHPEIIGVQTTVQLGSARMQITMVDPKERTKTQQQFQQLLRRELGQIPGVRANIQDLSQQGFGASRGSPIEFTVRGSDWPTLIAQAQKVQDELEQSGFAADVKSDYDLGPPQLTISPDRPSASDVNVSVSDIASTITALVGGQTVGQYSTAGRRMNIEMRLLADQRSRPEDLQLIHVRSSGGVLVPLSQVTKTSQQPQLKSINHANRQRSIRISANVAQGKAQSDALAYVATLQKGLAPGYSIVLSGQSSEFGDAMGSLVFALIIGILVAYMVLASQFNSFIDPITVFMALPFSFSGAFLGLLIGRQSLNLYSMIGLVLLMGIVKKNSILLVDFTNKRRETEKVPVRQALLEACPTRLRPILMTSLATVAGALPAAMSFGPGAETRQPMAISVIGGVLVSTFLTLYVVPCVYQFFARLERREKKLAAASGGPARA